MGSRLVLRLTELALRVFAVASLAGILAFAVPDG